MSKTGNDIASRGAGVQVALKLIDEDKFDHQGHLDFVDNAIDRSTGTIRVRVPGSPPYEAMLLPDAAIGTEQTRRFVLTVNADNTVVSKYVTLGQTTADNLRVIKDGLGPDDRVIVNGLLRARPGQKLTPQEGGKPGAASAQGASPPQTPK